ILEEPNWHWAKTKYVDEKTNILKKYSCLTKQDLDYILETVSGRVFCILYGLFGIPLCLVWISELGSFFGDRAKRLSQVLIRKGLSVKKVQLICTALFLLWGLVVHLVIPPLVFMSLEGVNPNIDYPRLYRVCAEIWIYMGLAWLSLFFSWNVHMVVQAHKVLKKRRQRHKSPLDEHLQPERGEDLAPPRPTVVDIFKFLSEEEEDYSTVIKKIGEEGRGRVLLQRGLSRSKSCSDLLGYIEVLEHSPKHRRRLSICEVFINAKDAKEDAISLADDGESEALLGGREVEDVAVVLSSCDEITFVPGEIAHHRRRRSSGRPAMERHVEITTQGFMEDGSDEQLPSIRRRHRGANQNAAVVSIDLADDIDAISRAEVFGHDPDLLWAVEDHRAPGQAQQWLHLLEDVLGEVVVIGRVEALRSHGHNESMSKFLAMRSSAGLIRESSRSME
ncbi:hypothetical protein CRUP_001342, partial [Coryphaenoides rupestris]